MAFGAFKIEILMRMCLICTLSCKISFKVPHHPTYDLSLLTGMFVFEQFKKVILSPAVFISQSGMLVLVISVTYIYV
jgi:hypothetical protein